jgi:membrane-associated phospholipid phosphatase
MADLVSDRPAFWPVDRVFIAYLAALAVVIAIAYPGPLPLIAAHAASIGLIAAAARTRRWPRLVSLFRHWYPLAFIPPCYRETALLIPAIRHTDFDAQIARLDYRLWGANPTVWLERLQNPWATEILQIAYTLFIPCVILVAVAIWAKKLYPEFRYYAFLVTLGFLASYVGYMLVPVRGPRFFLGHLQHVDLGGVWLVEPMRRVLDRLESAHFDCFPSGHTELTIIAWWSSRAVSKRLFAVFGLYTILIVTATVYLRYHYTVDVFAGMVIAAAVLAVSPGLYTALAVSRPARTTSTEVLH